MFFVALMVATLGINQSINATDRYYNCGITDVQFEDQSYSDKHIFIVTLKHTAKNKAEYNLDKTYDATVKLYLTSEDGTLEGNYTTNGFVSIGSTYDKDYINPNSTEVKVSGYSARRPHPNYESTFVIRKIGENLYEVGECALYVTDVQLNPTNMWCYMYSFNVNEIQEEDIEQTPFVFGIDTEFHETYTHYDMTVSGVSVLRNDDDYNNIRYFLTLACTGKNRNTGNSFNYEVQLAIYPGQESIVGEYATNGMATVLMPSSSYVKWLKSNGGSQTRYLDNDSISTIMIKSKGDNKYSFYGGTLICTIQDFNYSAVYGEVRVAETKYYHFSDNDGAGIEFGYDESNTTVDLTGTKVEVEETIDGFNVVVSAVNENSLVHTMYLVIDSENLAGTHQQGGTLSDWSYIQRGSSFEAESGSVVYITHKSGNTYTISSTFMSEGYTFNLAPFDFTYSKTSTQIDAIVGSHHSRKVMQNGVMLIERNGTYYTVHGTSIQQ